MASKKPAMVFSQYGCPKGFKRLGHVLLNCRVDDTCKKTSGGESAALSNAEKNIRVVQSQGVLGGIVSRTQDMVKSLSSGGVDAGDDMQVDTSNSGRQSTNTTVSTATKQETLEAPSLPAPNKKAKKAGTVIGKGKEGNIPMGSQ